MKKKNRKTGRKRRAMLTALTLSIIMVSGYFILGLLYDDPGQGGEVMPVEIYASMRTPHALERVTFEAYRPEGIGFVDHVVRWNFGDGREERGNIVSHTFGEEGAYRVSLVVDGPLGRGGAEIVMVVQSARTMHGLNPLFSSPSPTAQFPDEIIVSGPTTVCVKDYNDGKMSSVQALFSEDGFNWTMISNPDQRDRGSAGDAALDPGRWNSPGFSEWEFPWDPSGLPGGDIFLKAFVTDSGGRRATCAMMVQNNPTPPSVKFSVDAMDEVAGVFQLRITTPSSNASAAYFYEVATGGEIRSDMSMSLFPGIAPTVSNITGPDSVEGVNNFCGPSAAASIIMAFAEHDESILNVSQSRAPIYIRYFEEHRRLMKTSAEEYYSIDSQGNMRLKTLGISILMSRKMETDIHAGTNTGQLENGLRAFFRDQNIWNEYVVEGKRYGLDAETGKTLGPLAASSSPIYSQTIRGGDAVMLLLNEAHPGTDGTWGTGDDFIREDNGMWVVGVEHSLGWARWDASTLPAVREVYGLFDPASSISVDNNGVNMRAEVRDVIYEGTTRYPLGVVHRHITHGNKTYRITHMTHISRAFPYIQSRGEQDRGDAGHKSIVFLGSNHSWTENPAGGRIFTYDTNTMTGRDGIAIYVCSLHNEDGTVGWGQVMLYVNNEPPRPAFRVEGKPMEQISIHFDDGRDGDIMGASLSWYTGAIWIEEGDGFLGKNMTLDTIQLPDGDVFMNLTIRDFSGSTSWLGFIYIMPSIMMTFDGPESVVEDIQYINSETNVILKPLETGEGGTTIKGTTYYRIERNGTLGPIRTYTTPFNITDTEGDIYVEYHRIWENGYSTRIYRKMLRIDNTPPVFEIIEPSTGEPNNTTPEKPPILEPLQNITLRFLSESKEISSVAYYYKMPGTGQEILIRIENPWEKQATIIWDTTHLDMGNYLLRIIAIDILGQAHEETMPVEVS